MWIGSVEIAGADGKRRQKRISAKDYRRALQKLNELRDAVDSGIIPVTAKTSVEKWLTHWLETIKKPTVRPATADYYSEAIRLHIIPAIGSKQLDRLTPEDVRVMLRGITSSRNKQRAHQTLGLALKQAVKDGMLRRNVCEAVDKPGHVPQTRGAFAVDDAVAVMREAITVEQSRDATDPRLATRWVAAFLTGARQGELLGLEWDRVDLEAGVMDLSWQLQQLDQIHGCLQDGEPTCGRTRPGYCPQRKWDLPAGQKWRPCHRSLVWTEPKTKTGTRIVPIVEPLLSMLRQHHRNTVGEPNPHNLVWHYPHRPRNPGGPISPSDDQARWAQLLTAAGVPYAEIHAARHTTATLLQRRGIPPEVRMQITGHSSAAAHAAYIHVDQTQTRQALQGLSELLAL